MMIVPPLMDILLALLAVGTGTCGLCLVRARRRTDELGRQSRGQMEKLAALESELAALLVCSRKIAERLTDGERLQRALQKQIDTLHANDENHVNVQQAVKFLRNGVPIEEVTRLCELTQGEVEILQHVARHQRAA